MNFAARITSGRRKYDHISDIVRELGWLGTAELARNAQLDLLLKVISTEKSNSLASLIYFNHEKKKMKRNTRQSDHFLPLPTK